MSILVTIGSWIASNLNAVVSVVKMAFDIVTHGNKYSKSLKAGHIVLQKSFEEPPTAQSKFNRPNFSSLSNSEPSISEFRELIHDNKHKLQKYENHNIEEHNNLKLQLEIIELIISSQNIERYINNINIHASNLKIHIHTLKNTIGLVNDVNKQRIAIKAIMQKLNHLISISEYKNEIPKLSGIDVEKNEESISIFQAYNAFSETKNFLELEIKSYKSYLFSQFDLIESANKAACKYNKNHISKWLDESVFPRLDDAILNIDNLEKELKQIPDAEIVENWKY